MGKKLRVAVLFGGKSREREVSLASGKACMRALKHASHEIHGIDVGDNIAKILTTLRPDVALNMLHGQYGEDGCIQGLLEVLRIPYSHSGVLASALAMNKPRARDNFVRANIPVAKGMVVSRGEASRKHALKPPYVVKPIAGGSSVGVFVVKKGDAPPRQLMAPSWTFGETVLVEKYVAGCELTCAVMGNRPLDVIEILSELPFYNYKAKYSKGKSKHILPARIPKKIYTLVQDYALRAHEALGCRGVTRSDFRFNTLTGELVCLELNTQPGMTETSLVPEAAAYAGHSFPELVQWMIQDASLDR